MARRESDQLIVLGARLFEFFWGPDRKGEQRVQRRTSRKKLRNSLANFTQWCKQSRYMALRKLFPLLKQKLRGYYNYYGVTGNFDGLQEFFKSCAPGLECAESLSLRSGALA